MSKSKTHLSRVRQRGCMTITGTLCNRMSNAGEDINCTTDAAEVTCKFCLRILSAKANGLRRATFQPEAA